MTGLHEQDQSLSLFDFTVAAAFTNLDGEKSYRSIALSRMVFYPLAYPSRLTTHQSGNLAHHTSTLSKIDDLPFGKGSYICSQAGSHPHRHLAAFHLVAVL